MVHVALHPKYVHSISLGLVNHFNKIINQWHPQLNGILAGYGKLQLKKPTGQLINEEAHVHLDVQSEFWLFRPSIGRQLKGTVVKKSPGHVSCLVHGLFNVPCHRPQDIPKGGRWWATSVKLDSVVHLTVLKTDMSQKVPFILGKFSRQIVKFVLILLNNRWIFTEKVVNIWKGKFSSNSNVCFNFDE